MRFCSRGEESIIGELFDRYDGDVLPGSNIRIGEHYPEIFISDADEVFCYIGVCTDFLDGPRSTSMVYPANIQGKHSTDKRIAPHIRGFLRLQEGCIILDDYVDNSYSDDCVYKKVNLGIRFPYPDTYFGVLRNYGDEDEDITRKIFGLTCSDLEAVLEAYAKVLGVYSPYLVYPKLTRSGRGDNYCELTDLWIPAQFPYIAFENSGYAYSHISLWGFIRHVQLLKAGKQDSVIEHVLEKSGLDADIMDRLFAISGPLPSHPKVTHSTFYSTAI